MKKRIFLILLVIAIFALGSAANAQEYDFTQTVSFGSFSINVPDSFTYDAIKKEFAEPDGRATIAFGEYEKLDTPIYTTEDERTSFLNGFISADESSSYRYIQVDECTALLETIAVDDVMALNFVYLCNRYEFLAFCVSDYGEDCEDNVETLVDGMIKNSVAPETPTTNSAISATPEPVAVMPSGEYTQPCSFGSFTFYIPDSFKYNKEKDRYENYYGNVYIDFSGYDNMGYELYDEDATDYLSMFIHDEEYRYEKADECTALVRLTHNDLGITMYSIVLCNHYEIIHVLVSAIGGNDRLKTASDLVDGILSHVVAPEMPVEPVSK